MNDIINKAKTDLTGNRGVSEWFHGWEVLVNNGRMQFKMFEQIFAILMIVQMAIYSLLCSIILQGKQWTVYKYWIAKVLYWLPGTWNPEMTVYFNGKYTTGTASQIANSKVMAGSMYLTSGAMFVLFLLSCSIYVVGAYFLLKRAKAKTEEVLNEQHKHGRQLLTEQDIINKIEAKSKDNYIEIGERIKLPVKMEGRHWLILGSTGCGKTVFVNRTIEQINARGDKFIIHDIKGDFTRIWYRPGEDHLFNPLDERSVRWTIFNDAKSYQDVVALASSIIQLPAGSDPFWTNTARDMFVGNYMACWYKGTKSNRAFWDAICLTTEDMVDYLTGVPGAELALSHIAGLNNKADSIVGVFRASCAGFRFMAEIDGDFSVKQWVRSGHGNVFLTNVANVSETLRPLLTMFTEMVGTELLSMTDDINRQGLWFLLDEFGNLNRMNIIIKLLTLVRSKGGRMVLLLQDHTMIQELYGDKLAETIINNCNIQMIYRVNSIVGAEYCAKNIGKKEATEARLSQSMSSQDTKDGSTIGHDDKEKSLFLPSDIQGQDDHHFILTIATYGTCQCKNPTVDGTDVPKYLYPNIHGEPEEYLLDAFNLDNIIASSKSNAKKVEKVMEKTPDFEDEQHQTDTDLAIRRHDDNDIFRDL